MINDLSRFITNSSLQKLAGQRYYQRGCGYFENGYVGSLTEREFSISAAVSGTYRYQVKLWIDGKIGKLKYSCSCPLGMDGEFCKHLVAVGLKWLDEKNSGRFKDSDDQKVTSLSIQDWLARQSKNRLIEMIVDQAGVNDEFSNCLEMQASISTDNRIDMKRLKKSLRAVISIEDDLDYDKYYDYYAQVQKAVDNLKELLKQGYAAEVLELTEYALVELEKAIYCMYDSDWDIEYIVSELTDLHCKACKKIKPDVKDLAKLLYEWELNSDRYVYSGVVEKYFEILGDTGLDEYRRLIELA